MQYTKEQLEAIAKALRDMPPVEKEQRYNKGQAVSFLSKEITALQKRGYTLDQISESLRGKGLTITTPTLKNSLQRLKPVSKGVSKRTNKGNPVLPPADTPRLPPAAKPAEATFIPRNDTDDI